MPLRIRLASDADRDGIRAVHLRAFPEGEGGLVASLAVELLGEASIPETMGVVAEAGGELVGHVAFSPISAEGDRNWLGYVLAPLGVIPARQRCGIGSKLVRSGIERLKAAGVDVLFVYGDPKYYQRFGFSVDAAAGFSPPFELTYPFGWQAVVLGCGSVRDRVGPLSFAAPLSNPALW